MPILKTTTVILLIIISNIGFSQSNEISIKFIGNCGLYMTDGTTHIYTDFPYKSGAHGYMEFDSTELDSIKHHSIFIFTHKHSDHYSKKNLRKILKEKKGQTFGPWNIPELEKLGDSLLGFNIQAFKTEHKVFGISFKHYSYLLTWHHKKIYLSGDTESATTIEKITNLDWAFVPAWLVADANDKNIKIDAEKIGIYHIGPKDNVNISGEKVLMLKKQGMVITIPY